MGSLTAAIIAKLPTERLHLHRAAASLKREGKLWCLRTTNTSGDGPAGKSKRHFHYVLLATPVDTTRTLLQPLDPTASALIPNDASSAVLATFCWPADAARTFTIPSGFGFLVPPDSSQTQQLLACTFVDQKFPHRAPVGARSLRTFFGGTSADALAPQADAAIAEAAFTQLSNILGPLPQPDAALTTVRRWPRSLPQYEVGHLERIAELDTRIAILGHLTLLGNGYRGVGVPDLIHHSREAARALTER
jgi:oxygen-dependent protoporphyrinogen oxidase